MDLKRWTMALVLAVLLAALIGPAGTAVAAGGKVSQAGLIRHSPGNDSDESGENADNPDDADNTRDAGDPGDEGNDSSDNGSCTSVSSVAVCFDQPRN